MYLSEHSFHIFSAANFNRFSGDIAVFHSKNGRFGAFTITQKMKQNCDIITFLCNPLLSSAYDYDSILFSPFSDGV